jgi:hypothetical protein
MNWRHLALSHFGFLSVVIRHLYIVSIASSPAKTYPPLVIDAYAVLAMSSAGEFLQAIPWRNAQIVKSLGRIKE